MAQKIKPIPIAIQALNIKKMFPGTKVMNQRDQSLTWTHTLTPSPLGDHYDIKLVYQITDRPRIYVTNPNPLAFAKDETKLPHCYEQKKQHLCLYYPDGTEWNKSMLLATTVIPWAYEWLYHYEIWLGTGEWTGGGVHPVIKGSKKK
jgi:hypothetical protein